MLTEFLLKFLQHGIRQSSLYFKDTVGDRDDRVLLAGILI